MAFTKVTSTLADTLNQNTTGSAATLTTARTIGGTSFDGSANIAVALAATATALATARTIGGTSFDGTANITPGLAATATALATARTISGTSFDGTANIAVATATEATNITAVANNSADETVYPTFVDGATGTQGLETDTGFTYNPSSGDLTTAGQLGGATLSLSGNATVGGNLTVTGTSTVVNTVTMNAQNAIVFEGATADNYETTLSIVDPTADHTQYLINQGGYIPVLAASTTTAISATPAELNLLDGSTANSVVNSKAVVYGSSGELAGTLSTAAQTNVTSLGTLTTLTVDDITINGSTISDSGDLTIDVGGEIHLDSDSEIIRIRHDAGDIGMIQMTSNDLILRSMVSDKDLIFKGNDNGSVITALTLDMSDAGKATFNNGIVSNAGVVVDDITIDGSTISASSSLTLDLGGNLTINVDGTVVSLSDDTVNFGQFFNTGAGAFNIYSPTSNQDMVFRGNDGGSGIIALTLDMSAAGAATFNNFVDATNYKIGGGQGSDGQVLTSTGSGVAWEAVSGGATAIGDLDEGHAVSGSGDFAGGLLISNDGGTGTLDAAYYNTGFGWEVLDDLTTGDSNTIIGNQAGYKLTTGGSNTFIGKSAGQAVRAGVENVAVGKDALLSATNSDASNNTAVGTECMKLNTSGTQNAALGKAAMITNTTGNYNTALGPYALKLNSSGHMNTALGYEACMNTTASNNTAIGYKALYANTSGEAHVAIGIEALAAVTGLNHDAIAIGREALHDHTTPGDCIAIGKYAMTGTNSASSTQCIAIGTGALGGALAGYGNVGIGYYVMDVATSAIHNTGIGRDTLGALSTGDNNTCLGAYAGDAVTSGSNNVLIGHDAGSDALTTISTGSNNIIIGNVSSAVAEVKIDWTVGSDQRDKTDIETLPNNAGLNFVNQMRPVTYVWDNRSWYLPKDEDGIVTDRDITKVTPDGSKKSTTKQVGFLAQEIKAIEESIGWTEDHVVNTSNSQSYKLMHSQLIPILVKAIQELSAKVEALENS